MRQLGLTYGRFIDGLDKAGIEIDRKVLADLAIREPAAFQAIVEQGQGARCRPDFSRRLLALSGATDD